MNASKISQKVISFFSKKGDTSVINAEVHFTDFLVEHNIALNASDHAGQLFWSMFPDSKIAKEYASARTKTSNVMHTLADHDAKSKSLAGNVKNHPYSIATDGTCSTDQGAVKLYPVLLKTFDEDVGKVVFIRVSIGFL